MPINQSLQTFRTTSNILLDGDGKPMLADFGLARMLEESAGLTGSNLALGTPEYMAPEQALGLPADQRSDLYALGVILYRMLLGQTPFRAGTALATMMAHVHLPPPPPRSLDPDIDPRLDAILLKALAKDPDDRYETPWRSFGPTRRGVSEGLGDPQQNTFGWSPDRSGRLAAMPYRGGGGGGEDLDLATRGLRCSGCASQRTATHELTAFNAIGSSPGKRQRLLLLRRARFATAGRLLAGRLGRALVGWLLLDGCLCRALVGCLLLASRLRRCGSLLLAR